MQAGKQLRGMLNDFSIPPCGSTRGQRRDLGYRRKQLPGTGTGSQRLHSHATNHYIFCCCRGLEDGVAQLQGFWQWPGTDVFSGMSLRLCKGMSPGYFFSYKISPTFPICPTMGTQKAAWPPFSCNGLYRNTSRRYCNSKLFLFFPFLQGSLQEPRCSSGPSCTQGTCGHIQSRHSAFLLATPILCCPHLLVHWQLLDEASKKQCRAALGCWLPPRM